MSIENHKVLLFSTWINILVLCCGYLCYQHLQTPVQPFSHLERAPCVTTLPCLQRQRSEDAYHQPVWVKLGVTTCMLLQSETVGGSRESVVSFFNVMTINKLISWILTFLELALPKCSFREYKKARHVVSNHFNHSGSQFPSLQIFQESCSVGRNELFSLHYLLESFSHRIPIAT